MCEGLILIQRADANAARANLGGQFAELAMKVLRVRVKLHTPIIRMSLVTLTSPMNIYLATPEAATHWAQELAEQLPRDGTSA